MIAKLIGVVAVATAVVVGVRPGPACADLGQGLVAYWSFDEGSGSVVHDYVGGFNGTIYGATWVSGIDGSCLSFDGNDYVQFSDPIRNTPPYTFAVWVRPADFSGAPYIMSNGGQTGASWGMYFMIDQDTRYGCGCKSPPPKWGASPRCAHEVYDWTYLCCTWDGSHDAGSVKFYMNGVLVDAPVLQSWVEGGSAQNMRFGAPSNYLAYFFRGLMCPASVET